MTPVERLNNRLWWEARAFEAVAGLALAMLIGLAIFVGLSIEQWLHPDVRV